MLAFDRLVLHESYLLFHQQPVSPTGRYNDRARRFPGGDGGERDYHRKMERRRGPGTGRFGGNCACLHGILASSLSGLACARARCQPSNIGHVCSGKGTMGEPRDVKSLDAPVLCAGHLCTVRLPSTRGRRRWFRRIWARFAADADAVAGPRGPVLLPKRKVLILPNALKCLLLWREHPATTALLSWARTGMFCETCVVHRVEGRGVLVLAWSIDDVFLLVVHAVRCLPFPAAACGRWRAWQRPPHTL